MGLQARILHHLRRCDEPCNVVELAHAVGVLEPGDVVPDRLRSTLTGMVRHQQVRRVHHGDGVLRYSLACTAPAATGKPEAGPLTPPTATAAAATSKAAAPARTSHRYETGVSARVLAALVPGEAPVRRTVIESRISPPLSGTQVVMALQALRKKGQVVRTGTTSNAGWQLAAAKAGPETSAAITAADESISPTLLRARVALLQARSAIDAALQELEA